MDQATCERADLLAAIVDSSFDAIIGKTLDGTVTSWNPAAARLFGYRSEEIIGQSIRRLIPVDRQNEEDRILARIKAGERVPSYETVRLHKNGDLIDVFLTISPIRGADGTIIGASKILRDITSQKRTSETVRASEERLRQFVEQAPAAIAMFDRDMRYMACSRRWLSDYWPDATNVVGISHYEQFPETISEKWKEAHRRGLAGEVVQADEDPFARADGRTQWLRWEVRPWTTVDGVVGGITIFSEDVTERVEAARALGESELRMRLAQEAAKAGTWEWRLADNGSECSPSIWGLYGLEPADGELTFDMWASSIHPRDRDRIINEVREAAAIGREYEIQWRVNLPEGEGPRWLMARGRPIAGANGAPERYIGVAIDITDRKRAEEALRKAEKLERQKREELEAILAAIPAPVLIAKDASCEDMIGNPAAYELYRVPPGDNISKSAPAGEAPANFEIFQNGRRLPPEQLPIRKAAAQRAFSMEEIELRFVDGDSKYLFGNALPLFNDTGDVRGAVAAFADVTDLKRTERALRESKRRQSFLLALNDCLRMLGDPVEQMAAASAMLGEKLNAGQVAYAEIDEAGQRAIIARDWSDGTIPTNAATHKLEDFGPAFIEDLKKGDTVVIGDVRSDARTSTPEALATFERVSIGAFLNVPLVKAGRLVAVLAVHRRTPHAWSKDEVALAREVAERTWDAVERAKAQQELRDSELRMRLAQEAAKVGTWEWRLADDSTKWSESLWILCGINPQECEPCFDTWAASIHPKDRERIVKTVREAVAAGHEYEIQWRVSLPEGEPERWLMARGSPIAGANGVPERYIGVVIDITERKLAEEALRKAEERERHKRDELEAVLAALPVAVFIAKDANCGEMTGNRAAHELLRLSASKSLSKSAPPEQAPNNFEVFSNGRRLSVDELPVQRAAVTKTAVYAEEVELRFVEGDSRITQCNALPLFDAEGNVRGAVGVLTDITDLKRTEAALRESEERLRFALNAAKAGTWEVSLDDGALFMSDRARALQGLPDDVAVTEANRFAPVHREDKPRLKQAYQDLLRTGVFIPQEWRVVGPFGAIRWLESRGEPRCVAGKKVISGLLLDITERKRAENALREREELLHAIIEHIPVPIMLSREDRKILLINPALTEITGYEASDIPTRDKWEALAYRNDAPRIKENLRRAFEGGRPMDFGDYRVHTKSGERRLWSARTAPAGRDATGQRLVVTVALDITERERAEEDLRRSEARYRTLVQATSAVTWSCPPSGYHVIAQPEWMAFTGQTAEEMLGDGWSKAVHPDDLAVLAEGWADAVARGEPFISEHRIRRHDGVWRWMSVHAAPIRDASGAIVEWIGMNIDITERKEAEVALQQAEALQRNKREELETILTALPAAVLIANDPDCLDVTGNPAAYEVLQLPLGTNLSKSAQEAPTSFEMFQDGRRMAPKDMPLRKAAAKTNFAREEIEIRFADGSSKFLLGNALPLFDEAGNVRGAVAAHADITELKRTEAALRNSEERLRFALNAAKAGAWELEPATGKLVVSDRALSFLDMPPDTPVTFETVGSRMHPEDRAPVEEALRHALETGAPSGLEWRVIRPDGSIRWLETRGERRTVSGRQVIAGLVLDITPRKKSEEDARAAKTMLEAALAAMSDAVLITDPEGRFLHTNDAFAIFHKFQSKDEYARTLAQFPEVFDLFLSNGSLASLAQWPIYRAFNGESAEEAEYALHRRDTGELWVGSYNFAPIRNGSGQITGTVVTARDITHQKAAERRLRESEARLSSIIDTAADSIIVIDERGLIKSANRATAAIFGHAPEEIIGRNVSLLMPPTLSDRHDRFLKGFSGKGAVRQVEGLRKDGAKIPVDVAVAEWRDGENRRFFTGILRDLTERKKSEEALANARRLEAVGQLAGGVAHDFNNLLSVISGNLEIAQDHIDDKTVLDLIGRARSAAEKGSALNQRLLSLARKRALKPQRLNLNERVQDTAKLLASTVGEHIAVTTELAAGIWPTLADPGEIDSAILNLAANARDAMPGGGNIRISTSNVALDVAAAAKLRPNAKPGDYVCLAISDDGPGMPADVLAKAFEPFFTTKGPGAGTGLGLASVATFSEQAGGFTVIESAPGQGCAVSVYLPRVIKPSQERSLAPSGLPLGRGELVLVVEDDELVREVSVKRLESLGYAVIEAKNGPEAIKQLLSQEQIRLVLSDIVMPGGMTGYDVTRWVASNKPGVKVIMCTGYSDGDRRGGAQGALNGVQILGKPYTREQLARAVDRALSP
jgi:PAS domain S-box-containing protein